MSRGLDVTDLDLQAKGYLIDLDGTLVSGRHVLPDARWVLAETAGRHVIMSNNAEHTPAQLSKLLRSIQLSVPAERIVLAGTCAIDEIAEMRPGCVVMLIGSAALKSYARSKGLKIAANSSADIVLVARDRHFTYAKLAAAAAALHDGAKLYVAAPDLCHPGVDGRPVPETGALAAAIAAASGSTVHKVIGKPQKSMFEIGRRILGVEFCEMVMIGDNPDTDGLGAGRLGMRFHRVHGGLIRPQIQFAAE
jgi:HAD superfamily hydrolase (TIGR01450 family)